MWCDGAHERSGHDVQVVVVGWVLMAVSAQDREQARSNGKHVCVGVNEQGKWVSEQVSSSRGSVRKRVCACGGVSHHVASEASQGVDDDEWYATQGHGDLFSASVTRAFSSATHMETSCW
jgi:hypothetical protein